MNKMPDKSIVVLEINDAKISIITSEHELIRDMMALGFKFNKSIGSIPPSNEENKLNIISHLIDCGALFVFGYGWYPSEVLGYYKDQGKLKKSYKVISWSSPDSYLINEVD